jgi:hypothetical protein
MITVLLKAGVNGDVDKRIYATDEYQQAEKAALMVEASNPLPAYTRVGTSRLLRIPVYEPTKQFLRKKAKTSKAATRPRPPPYHDSIEMPKLDSNSNPKLAPKSVDLLGLGDLSVCR